METVITQEEFEELCARKEQMAIQVESDLMHEVQTQLVNWIATQGYTQTQAAHVLGITQPRVSNLVAGKLDKFSLAGVLRLAIKAGLKIEINLQPIPSVEQ